MDKPKLKLIHLPPSTEALPPPVKPQEATTEEAGPSLIGAVCACVLGVVLGLMVTGLCLFLFP